MAWVLPQLENEVQDKRVESVWFPCADEGSTPSSSTYMAAVHKHVIIAIGIFVSTSMVKAQDSLNTRITYDLTTEASVGTGDYTAFQLVTNRHHVMGTRSNTAYLRGAVHAMHSLNKKLTLSGAIDVVASVHADHEAYLQQCYANLSYGSFFVEAGSRENTQVLRDDQLSTGSFVKGTNAKPIPQVHFGTNGFWTVPNTNDWLQINFDFGYGKFMDNNYHERMFSKENSNNSRYTTGTYYHQKHLYFRSNPAKRFFAIAGIEHAVQFAGTRYEKENGELTVKKKPANLEAFWNVILPIGDSNYFEKGSAEDWVYGNHIGIITVQMGWNINNHHQIQAYLDNPFEDGSGMRKGNGWDGLWGLQYNNKAPGKQFIRKTVFEYFQTINQCGPLHWDSNDYPEPIRSQVTDFVAGNDNYYNHFFYDGYAYYGMTPGNALITSPIYNKNGFLEFRDNRIIAWHLGVNGEITDKISYLAKGSYREGWGTYISPLPTKHYSFNAMLQGMYSIGPWQFSAAYAFDKDNIYGDCSTFNLKIGFHGKIL